MFDEFGYTNNDFNGEYSSEILGYRTKQNKYQYKLLGINQLIFNNFF